MALTPAQRSLRARIGAHAMHSKYNAASTTARARETFLMGFEYRVDPERLLQPEERHLRAQHALKAHMSKLSLAAARARTRRREEQTP